MQNSKYLHFFIPGYQQPHRTRQPEPSKPLLQRIKEKLPSFGKTKISESTAPKPTQKRKPSKLELGKRKMEAEVGSHFSRLSVSGKGSDQGVDGEAYQPHSDSEKRVHRKAAKKIPVARNKSQWDTDEDEEPSHRRKPLRDHGHEKHGKLQIPQVRINTIC